MSEQQQDDRQEMPVAGSMPEPVDGDAGEPAAPAVEMLDPKAEDYSGEQWTVEELRAELVRRDQNREAADEFMPRLADYILTNLPGEIDPTLGEVDAVAIAIRVLDRYLRHPGGRLEPVVREAISQLDNIPAATPTDQLRAELELIRTRLAEALTAPPRPGGGPEPVYESDDITLVRFDRDRFRVELNLVCVTLAEMYAAATGRKGLPFEVGPVEDLQNLRYRLVAAEEALTNALRHRCDLTTAMPKKGTEQYAQLSALVGDIVAALADDKAQRVGWPT